MPDETAEFDEENKNLIRFLRDESKYPTSMNESRYTFFKSSV